MSMIESWFFVFAMIAVLLIPGPTNALLASSTHQQGVLKTLPFIPMEWLGYVYSIGHSLSICSIPSGQHSPSFCMLPVWPMCYGWPFIYGKVHTCKNMTSITHISERQSCLSRPCETLKPCCWRQGFFPVKHGTR